MRASELISGIEYLRRTGPDPEITAIEYDSRRVNSGSLFVAMRGGTSDGNRFIHSAAQQGAAALVTDSGEAFQAAECEYPKLAVIQVTHGRRALATLSASFFGHPEKHLAISGVTGTNGKTTTAFLLDAMLNRQQRKTVLVGTIEYHLAGQVLPSPHTTPESRDLFALFADGLRAGATEAVMEVSSHALDQGRTWGLPFDVAIFTNLTRDHLDFHGSMESYFATKRSLFDGRSNPPPRVAVANFDDPRGLEIAEAARGAGAEIRSYGLIAGDFRAEDVIMTPAGMRFRMITPGGDVEISTRLTGRVNVYNFLAAAAAAMARGLDLQQIASIASSLPQVPGRFQTVDAGQPFTVVVDYAHTDDALRNLTAVAHGFVTQSGGRVITLFGCGGDRDRTKRPLMGQAAGEGSDFVVVTSDNPRTEDPLAIINEVLPGLRQTGTSYVAEPLRETAIRIAIEAATAGDIVLLAGKGHEKTQTLREGTIPFDDVLVARKVLAELGFGDNI